MTTTLLRVVAHDPHRTLISRPGRYLRALRGCGGPDPVRHARARAALATANASYATVNADYQTTLAQNRALSANNANFGQMVSAQSATFDLVAREA